jgi:polyhydroxybutyrate depolymerase
MSMETTRPAQTPSWKKVRRWLLRLLVVFVLGIGVIAGVLYYEIHRTNGEVLTGGKKRSYLLYVPKTYQPGRPTPLVISLHGFSEWPAHLMELSHWNRLADEFGFLVVYPKGSAFPLRWFCHGPFAGDTKAGQDVQFISDLIDQLGKNYNIDAARVYANGLSNGGGMSFWLACRLSQRIAAFGSVGGAYLVPWDQYKPQRPVPAIVFHGTADPLVPYDGGGPGRSRIPFPDIPQWVQALAVHNGCQPTPTPLPAVGEVSGLCYTGGVHNAEVVFYTVAGGGHTWPGGKAMPRFIVGETTRDVDATRLMWDFFQQHPMVKP